MPVGLPSIRLATLNGVLLSKFDVDMMVVREVKSTLSTYKGVTGAGGGIGP